MEKNKELWERFDALRGEMSLAEFCRINGFSYDAVQAQYYGKTVPKTRALILYARALNTSVEYLYCGEDVKQEPLVSRVRQVPDLIEVVQKLLQADEKALWAVKKILDVGESKENAER